MRVESDDPVHPKLITHACDEIFEDDGALSQRYNFLVYVFEREGWSIGAKAYLDEIQTVSIFPAESQPPRSTALTAHDESARDRLLDDVRVYLKRRYRSIQRYSRQLGIYISDDPH